MAKGKSGVSRKAEGASLATPKMQTLVGSQKQVTWAENIRSNAFATLRNMEPSAGKTSGGYDKVRFDKKDLVEVNKALTSMFSAENAKKASFIIDKRGQFSSQRIEALVIGVHRDGMSWDDKKRQFVKRK